MRSQCSWHTTNAYDDNDDDDADIRPSAVSGTGPSTRACTGSTSIPPNKGSRLSWPALGQQVSHLTRVVG